MKKIKYRYYSGEVPKEGDTIKVIACSVGSYISGESLLGKEFRVLTSQNLGESPVIWVTEGTKMYQFKLTDLSLVKRASTEGNSETSLKEVVGKTSFKEIDWNFIKGMSDRMDENKPKYEVGNWKKPLTEEGKKDLLRASIRHAIKIIDPTIAPEDEESELDHLHAIACNAMMVAYHTRKNN